MGLGTILTIVLILLLIGALPTWPHSNSWGYTSIGILGNESAHPQRRIVSLWNAAAGTPLYA